MRVAFGGILFNLLIAGLLPFGEQSNSLLSFETFALRNPNLLLPIYCWSTLSLSLKIHIIEICFLCSSAIKISDVFLQRHGSVYVNTIKMSISPDIFFLGLWNNGSLSAYLMYTSDSVPLFLYYVSLLLTKCIVTNCVVESKGILPDWMSCAGFGRGQSSRYHSLFFNEAASSHSDVQMYFQVHHVFNKHTDLTCVCVVWCFLDIWM